MGTNTLFEHTFPCTSRWLGSAPHFILALVVGADVRDSPPRPPTPPFPGQHLREQLAETTAELNSLKALLAAAVPQPQLESTHPETAKRPEPSNLLISKQDRVTIPGTWVLSPTEPGEDMGQGGGKFTHLFEGSEPATRNPMRKRTTLSPATRKTVD